MQSDWSDVLASQMNGAAALPNEASTPMAEESRAAAAAPLKAVPRLDPVALMESILGQPAIAKKASDAAALELLDSQDDAQIRAALMAQLLAHDERESVPIAEAAANIAQRVANLAEKIASQRTDALRQLAGLLVDLRQQGNAIALAIENPKRGKAKVAGQLRQAIDAAHGAMTTILRDSGLLTTVAANGADEPHHAPQPSEAIIEDTSTDA